MAQVHSQSCSSILEGQKVEGKGLNDMLKIIPGKIASYCLIQWFFVDGLGSSKEGIKFSCELYFKKIIL
jgi:hypothetical protein